MTAALQTFNTPFSTQLRVIDREGQPWFIAKDVLLTLEIGGRLSAGPSPYLKHLSDHERGLVTVLTPRGGEQQVLAVNESGFYKLVLKSRKPEARKFQDWVTGVVLPAIRKDGGYVVGQEKLATGEDCGHSMKSLR